MPYRQGQDLKNSGKMGDGHAEESPAFGMAAFQTWTSKVPKTMSLRP